jgi:hypothetical protein
LTLIKLLRILSLYGTAIPFLVGLFLYKKFDSTFKKVFFYAASAVVFESVAKILSINYYPNTFVYSAFSVVEFFIIIAIFYPMLTYKFTNALYAILIAVFVLVYFWCRLFATGIHLRLYAQVLTGSFCLLLFAAFTMYKLSEEMNQRLIKNSHFLFTAAVSFFFTTNLFVYAARVALTMEEFNSFYNYIWGIHSLVNFLFHLILTLAMWYNSQRIK